MKINFKAKMKKILPTKPKGFWANLLAKIEKRQFKFFIGGTLVITFLMLGASIWMYNEFGTAQLDLSRPSLEAAREQAKKESDENKNQESEAEGFSREGEINSKVLRDFEKLYDAQSKKIKGDFFGEGALSDETLNLKPQNQENQEE
ncbi:MAG: hypothetical protein Q4A27_01410 [bacterium]|nr:hypothetical protein [bacterium]